MSRTEMAELGLNVFQVIQNELISREGSRSSLGLGFRLAVLEERMMNVEAVNRNGKVWKPNHHVSPIAALTPAAKEELEKRKKQLLERKGAKKMSDDKDPTMYPRKEERWEVHRAFPRTLLDFKELQYHPDRVRSLLEFYEVKVYRHDFQLVDINPGDRNRDVAANIETCLEELAMEWGINWQRIGGLSMPYPATPLSTSSSQLESTYTPVSSQVSSTGYSERRASVQHRSSPPPQSHSALAHQPQPPSVPTPPTMREV